MLSNTLLLFNLGNGEIVLIVIAMLLLFGAKKIPELARGIGKGVREFKDATGKVQDEMSRPPAADTTSTGEETTSTVIK